MKRLTKRNPDWPAWPLLDRPRGALCTAKFCTLSDRCDHIGDRTCPYLQMVDRLAAIEDILGDEYDLARLRELAQADREGRCVVQKFAPGSEVWVVERDEDGEATEVSGLIFVVSINGIAIVSPTINDCSDLDFILDDFVEETASSFSGDFSGYPISDCYKSHEEAKAALRREQDG